MQYKRILSILLALCLLCVCLPTTAMAAEIDNGTCGDNLTWTLSTDGTLTISGTGAMTEYSSFFSVPWDGYREIITSVVIGDGVTSIGAYAFYECLNLPAITIPAGITAIGSSAFEYCRSLPEITIPAGVTVIGPRAFRECSSLAQIHFAGDAPAISNSAFENVTAKVSYPADSDTWTENTILSYGGTLTWGDASEPAGQPDVSIASGTCGAGLIWGITADGTLTISGTGAMTEYSTFTSVPWDSYREIITSVVIGDGVTSIGAYAFYECINLPEITIPATVTAIGASAFQFCYSLTKITFTGNAPTISDTAFKNVTATVYYPTDDATWTADVMKSYGGVLSWGADGQPVEKPADIWDSGVCGDNLTWILSTDGTLTISGTGAMTDYDTFTSVPWDAYREFISSVVISEGVTSIGAYALFECINLPEITIPASVTRIDANAFVFCNSLTEITFLGDCPEMTNALDQVTATAYYPADNDTWTEDVMQNYNGTITWVAYEPCDFGHDYEAVVTAPTCTEGGYTTHTCTVCGDSYVDTYVDALGHDYEAIMTAPTCTEGGYTTYTCTVCGDSYVDSEVDATGHSYEAVVTAPTYDAQGFTTYTCANCGDSYVGDYVDALIHYDVLEGNDMEWTEESEEPVSVRVDADIAKFVKVLINGKVLDPVNYTVTEDSTIIVTLKPEYLATLPTGKYTMTIVFTNGDAETTFSVQTEVEPYALGDINGDGEIDLLDANLIVSYYNGTVDLTEAQLLASDLNGDGEIDLLDANLIVSYYNGTIDSFPVEE